MPQSEEGERGRERHDVTSKVCVDLCKSIYMYMYIFSATNYISVLYHCSNVYKYMFGSSNNWGKCE